MAGVELTETEMVYILNGIEEDMRSDGRGCEDYRPMEIETGVVTNTDGSSKITLGNTVIVVGVKAEIGKPTNINPDEGYLEFCVDCSANANPAFEGKLGDDIGTEMSNILYRVFNSKYCLDLKGLCINPGEHCWVLNVDVLVLQCDGNLYDASSIAIKAALYDTKIPKVNMSTDDEGKLEIELSDDPFDFTRLNVENVPCIITLSLVGHKHVVDTTLDEKACSVASMLVAVTEKGTITCTRKIDGGSLDPQTIFEMTETGKQIGMDIHGPLMEVLKKEESMDKDKQKRGFLR